MRGKLAELEEAFNGRFDDHHAFLLTKMLGRVDQINTDMSEVERRIETEIAPFANLVERLDQIPGIGPTTAWVIISEIGVDMSRFPTPAHLCSWARFSPAVKESAGKSKGNGATGRGNRYLARVLGEAAVTAGRTDTFLGERYRRLARRRGKRTRQSWRWDAPSWLRYGICCPIRRSGSLTLVRTSTTGTAQRLRSSGGTCNNSKRSDIGSPSNLLPELSLLLTPGGCDPFSD